MTITSEELAISRPCPVDLDEEFRGSAAKRHYCDHCRKDVHMLSAMTEREATVFLSRNEGKDICISYHRRRNGEVAFAPEPVVPVTQLLRKRPKRRSRLAAVGVTVALAACTPHGTPQQLELEPEVEQVELVAGGVGEYVEPTEVVEETPLRGKMPLKVEPETDVEEAPCESPESESKPAVERPPKLHPVRGRRRTTRDKQHTKKPQPQTMVLGQL